MGPGRQAVRGHASSQSLQCCQLLAWHAYSDSSVVIFFLKHILLISPAEVTFKNVKKKNLSCNQTVCLLKEPTERSHASTYDSSFPRSHCSLQNNTGRSRNHWTSVPQYAENMSRRLTLNLFILHVSSWIWVRDSGAGCLNGNEPTLRARLQHAVRHTHSFVMLAVTNETEFCLKHVSECIDLFSQTAAD